MSCSNSFLVAQRNLIVEGVDDFWIITELSRLFERSNLPSLPADIFITPAGGASEAVYLATFMIGQKLDVIVLLDSDKAGQDAKDKLVKNTKVLKKEKLLDHWFSITQKPRHYDFFVQSPKKFLQDIKLDYALTTYMAENILNHYLFPSRTDLYIKEDDLLLWRDKIIKNGLVGKGNLRLLIYDEHTMYKKKKINGLWVASIPQVLIDLRREGGVCQEAYDMMVEKYVRRK